MIFSWINRLPLVAILAFTVNAAAAHEIRPAIVTAVFAPEHRYEITVVANLEALLAGIGPVHADTNESPSANLYSELRALPPDTLRTRFNAFAPRWLAGIHAEFDGARVEPRISAISVPPAGDLALARLSSVTLSGEIRQMPRYSVGAMPGISARTYCASSAPAMTKWSRAG